MKKPSERYQFVRFYSPAGEPFIAIGEVLLNERGEVWDLLPQAITFIGVTEADLINELEKALADCRAHPVFDTASTPADPPADLIDDIRREQLQSMTPPTKSKH